MAELLRAEFSFNGIPLKQKFGATVAHVHDSIFPAARARKIMIPGKDGRYDYGVRNREERSLILDCNIARILSRAELRELSYLLSDKGEIRLWNEPDKYYIGQLYNPEELQKVGLGQREFSLDFTCEPFAYGEQKVEELAYGSNTISYNGTASSPPLIILKNTGTEPIKNVQITALYKK